MKKRYIGLPLNVHDNFDHVPLEMPLLMEISKIVVFPLKTVFLNTCAEPGANITRYFTDLDGFAEFCEAAGIEVE